MKFQVYFKEVSRVFQGRSEGFLKGFQGEEIQKVFQGSLKVFHGSLRPKGSFKCISRKFQGRFEKVSVVFQGSLNCVSRMIESFFKGLPGVLQKSLKGV